MMFRFGILIPWSTPPAILTSSALPISTTSRLFHVLCHFAPVIDCSAMHLLALRDRSHSLYVTARCAHDRHFQPDGSTCGTRQSESANEEPLGIKDHREGYRAFKAGKA